DALLSVLLKFAPKSEAGPWVRNALDKLEYQMKTRAWPTKGELGAVCSNLRKEAPRIDGDATGPDMTPEAINGRRMMKGEPVGESWLYGVLACELIAGRHVDEATMTAYRSGAFFARREMYGDEAAKAWEADAKARHEAAKASFRDKTLPSHRRRPSVNVNRMEAAE
ncbi:MAG: hypothetical protein EBT13_16865, partial [Rhodobacteraceae bacterium]|nr:hypothetical protein [Paracoccaceae bacterium]